MPKCDTCEYSGLPIEKDPCLACWPSDRNYTQVRHQDTPQEAEFTTKEADSVNHPGHYTEFPLEVIDVIKLALDEAFGEDGFKAYCFGNELKYRLRAGFKGEASEDIKKALKYKEFRGK